MTDAAVQNAEKARDDLAAKVNAALAQVEEWKREIARIDQFVADWHRFAGTSKGVEPRVLPKPVGAGRSTKNSSKEDVARVTREIIAVTGAPVLRPVLLNMLRERGLIIEGAEPETVLSTMLWRMRDAAKIVHLKNVGYWTAEARWPPAHYIPNEKAEPKENDPLSSDRRERELDDMTAKLEEALKRPFAPYKA